MAQTLEEVLVTQLGRLTFQCAQLGVQIERLQEENARLKASQPQSRDPLHVE